MSLVVHLVRHGETASSRRVYAGRRDVPLTAHGDKQAEVLAGALCRRPITRIVSSPLSRARATAAPLSSRLGLAVEIDQDLLEFDFGDLEGRPKSTGKSLRKTHLRDPVPGGESLLMLWQRIANFVRRLPSPAEEEEETQIAVFAHYWVNRLLFGHATGLTLEEACRSRVYRPLPGSLLTISMQDGRQLCMPRTITAGGPADK